MHDLTPAYALDALDDDERIEYEEHLRTCAQCQEELAGLRDTVGSLAYATPAPDPPAALRARLLSSLDEPELARVIPLRRRRPVQALGGAVALAAAAAIALGIWAGSLSRSLDTERAAARDQAAALEVLAASEVVRVPLDGADGSLVVAADGRGVLVLPWLAAAPAGQTYEAWLIRDGVARPAGLFRGGEQILVRLDGSVTNDAIVAVTLEPAGGVDQPSGEPLFSAAVT